MTLELLKLMSRGLFILSQVPMLGPRYSDMDMEYGNFRILSRPNIMEFFHKLAESDTWTGHPCPMGVSKSE